jgi:hypothetical protein
MLPHIRHFRSVYVTLCLAVMGTFASPARANGRYPLANELVVDPSAPSHLVARTTFGLLDSRDAGATWRWICEQAVNPNGLVDPAIAVTASGRTLVSVDHGVAISQDDCAWHISSGLDESLFMIDFAIDPMNARRVVGLVDDFSESSQRFDLFESLDEGENWSALSAIASADVAPTTLEVAPSGRIYLAGMHPSTGGGFFMRVDRDANDVLTDTVTDFDLSGGANAFVAAVDPNDSNRAYIRTTAGASGEPGRLLVTNDAGATFQEVLSLSGGLSGFALAPDGAKVAAGSSIAGVSTADTTTFDFQKKSAVGPLCLTWTARGLFVCATEAQDQMTIGLSSDDGATFATLLHLDQIVPLVCDADAQESAACAGRWSVAASTLGVEGGTGPVESTTGLRTSDDQAPDHSGCACTLGGRDDGRVSDRLAVCLGVLVVLLCMARRRSGRNKINIC